MSLEKLWDQYEKSAANILNIPQDKIYSQLKLFRSNLKPCKTNEVILKKLRGVLEHWFELFHENIDPPEQETFNQFIRKIDGMLSGLK